VKSNDEIFENNILDNLNFDNWNNFIEDKSIVFSNLIDQQLVSCSNDSSIKIWDLKTFEFKESFLSTEPIQELIRLSNNYFFSFYRCNFIQLWDLSQKLCVKSFYSADLYQNYHCVRYISGTKFARAHYNYIKIWDLGASHELTLKGHKGWIFDLLVLTNQLNMLVSCSSDRKIKIWNKKGDCIETLRGHKNWILCISVLKNGDLASGSLDKTIKIWNIEAVICINTLRGHKKGISTLVTKLSGELF